MITSYADILESQKDYFNTNKTKDISFRISQLKHLKTVILRNEDKLCEALSQDLGKSSFETNMTELIPIYSEINKTIKKLKSWAKRKRVRTNLANFPARSYIISEPLGSALVISAWNYPYQISLMPCISAIAAGNTVILKPSEISPSSSEAMAEIINSEFPKELFYVVQGGIDETTELLSLKFDKIFYTGNSKVGRIVSIAAAKNLTPICLELGGKSPAIIDSTCDIKISAQRLIWAKFLNSGQTCVAPDFVLLDKKIELEFLDEIKHNINRYYKLDTAKADNYTNIINERHFDRLERLIKKNKLFMGANTNRDKLFISPTILRNIDWDDDVMQEEIFGPILPIITYENIDTVIPELKKRSKPLALYIFSKNNKFIDKILNEVSFGGGCVNDALMQLSNKNLPFGGVGESGSGRYYGESGFKEFSNFKSILHRNFLFEFPLKYFPYSKKKLEYLKKLV